MSAAAARPAVRPRSSVVDFERMGRPPTGCNEPILAGPCKRHHGKIGRLRIVRAPAAAAPHMEQARRGSETQLQSRKRPRCPASQPLSDRKREPLLLLRRSWFRVRAAVGFGASLLTGLVHHRCTQSQSVRALHPASSLRVLHFGGAFGFGAAALGAAFRVPSAVRQLRGRTRQSRRRQPLR